MATELGKAYVQIIPSADGIQGKMKNVIEKNMPDVSNAGGSIGKSLLSGAGKALKSGASKLGSIMASTAKTAVKGATVAMAGAAAGVTAIVKQSVDAYAAYEQNVGGVETLFKKNADTVVKYASEAYKTAGMSANAYMENVTSFSASLLQGLGGDTEQAADIANQAMIDMSDNANKFGTDISSIQNAYQGFAKQNYTMLDNLKLGYGGTQAEMARMINDTGVMGKDFTATAKNINEVSFDKIIEAIHIVQDDMGVTGTTAKEAATTISGSIGQMKGAWANLMAGMGDKNADIPSLIGNLVESISTVGGNMLPVIEQALDGVVTLISQLAPKLVDALPNLIATLLPNILTAATTIVTTLAQNLPQILTTLITAIAAQLPDIVNAVVAIAPLLVDGLIQIVSAIIEQIPVLLPTLLDGALQLFMALLDGLNQVNEQLQPMIPDIINMIVTALMDNMPAILDGAFTLFTGICEGLSQNLPLIMQALVDLVGMMVVELAKHIPEIIEAGADLLAGLALGLCQILSPISDALADIWLSITSFFSGLWDKCVDIGSNIISGIGEGLKAAATGIWDTISSVGDTIVDGFCDFFGIHSPSRLFRDRVGKNLALGIGVGFTDNIDSVNKEMQDGLMTDFETTASITSGVNALNSSIPANATVGTDGTDGGSNTITFVLADAAYNVLAKGMANPMDIINGNNVAFAGRGLA